MRGEPPGGPEPPRVAAIHGAAPPPPPPPPRQPGRAAGAAPAQARGKRGEAGARSPRRAPGAERVGTAQSRCRGTPGPREASTPAGRAPSRVGERPPRAAGLCRKLAVGTCPPPPAAPVLAEPVPLMPGWWLRGRASCRGTAPGSWGLAAAVTGVFRWDSGPQILSSLGYKN